MSGDWQVSHVNCFESLKLSPLQRKDEISLDVICSESIKK
nr:MAG TPA: hypothetical protein [Caudoviricetes sp.]